MRWVLARDMHPQELPPSSSGKGVTLTALVIGFGNPLRQDDGFGWHVAEQLLTDGDLQGAEVIACQQLTPELAEPLSRVQVAVFVDVRVGEPAGLLECAELTAEPQKMGATAHNLTPPALLAMAQALYGSAPRRAYLLTARSRHFDHADGLSPELQAVLPEAVAQIRHLVADCARAPAG